MFILNKWYGVLRLFCILLYYFFICDYLVKGEIFFWFKNNENEETIYGDLFDYGMKSLYKEVM